MVLWNTSPQPPGNVLETHRRAPGSARALLREGEFPRTHCRVSKRLEVDVGCPSVAALGEGSAHARPSLHSPFLLRKCKEPATSGWRRAAMLILGFPVLAPGSKERKKPQDICTQSSESQPTKKGRTAGVPLGRGCEVRDESQSNRSVNRKCGQKETCAGRKW